MSSPAADMIETDFANPEKQKARSFLRERFLRLLSSVKDLDCTLHMYDETVVKAKFGGPDNEFFKVFMKDLETATSKYPQVLVRTSDILSIEIPKASCQKLIKQQEVPLANNDVEMKDS